MRTGDPTIIHDGSTGYVAILRSANHISIFCERHYVYERLAMAFWLDGRAAVWCLWCDEVTHLENTCQMGDTIGEDLYLSPDEVL